MKDQILILSNSGDESTEAVTEHLESLGEQFYRFNTEQFPMQTMLTIRLSGSILAGTLKRSGERNAVVDLRRVKSVWYRRPVVPWPAETLHEGYQTFIREEARTALWSLYTTLEAYWINPPLIATKLLGENKLYQLRDARRVGLSVPVTIITNNPKELLRFTRRHGNLAVKALSANFFLREHGGTELLFTTPISEKDIRAYWDGIQYAPVLAQEYVPKRLELRITVVGENIFPCAIHSQDSEFTRHDWRNYDFNRVKHEQWELPQEIIEKLLALMRQWNLVYGAVDMILTPDGEYVFLEINPIGQWLWIEQVTGMPISRAIAEALAHPPSLA